jgi:hypothetical protein
MPQAFVQPAQRASSPRPSNTNAQGFAQIKAGKACRTLILHPQPNGAVPGKGEQGARARKEGVYSRYMTDFRAKCNAAIIFLGPPLYIQGFVQMVVGFGAASREGALGILQVCRVPCTAKRNAASPALKHTGLCPNKGWQGLRAGQGRRCAVCTSSPLPGERNAASIYLAKPLISRTGRPASVLSSTPFHH